MFFREIIGQEKVKQRVCRLIDNDHIAHALLISGKEGVGKLSLALSIAQYLHCTHKQNGDSCGSCPSCRKYKTLEHPDIHFVFPLGKAGDMCCDYEKKFRTALIGNPYLTQSQWMSSLGNPNASGVIYTKEADEIARVLNMKSYEADYKIMLIWLPEKMHERASNKLLKLIEEPFPHTLLLLVSDSPEEILPTILSRLQSIEMPPISVEDITQYLIRTHGLSEVSARKVAYLSEGSISKATEFISVEEHTSEYKENFLSLMRNAYLFGMHGGVKDLKSLKEWSEKIASIGKEQQIGFLQYITQSIRESFILHFKEMQNEYGDRGESAFLKNLSPFITEKNIEKMLKLLDLAEQQIVQNINAKILFFDVSIQMSLLIRNR